MSTPFLSVIIPLYNEEQNMALLQQELETALKNISSIEYKEETYEVIFVDDGSTDKTVARVDQNNPHIRLLCFEKNAGQSAAMYAGLKAAKGEVLVLLDGDLQNDPADISKLISELERTKADLVCGYRAHRKDTLTKRLTSRVANFVRSRFVGDAVRDTGCTLKAMRRECVNALIPFVGMHRFIPALIKGAGYKLVEIPVNHRPRSFGVSKYGFGNRSFRATMDMLGVYWLLSRRMNYRVK